MLPTKKQLNCISIIEENTERKFNGFSFEEASDFITRYLKESIELSNMPTIRQIKAAHFICLTKKINFTGKTKFEYYQFINKHKELFGNYIR